MTVVDQKDLKNLGGRGKFLGPRKRIILPQRSSREGTGTMTVMVMAVVDTNPRGLENLKVSIARQDLFLMLGPQIFSLLLLFVWSQQLAFVLTLSHGFTRSLLVGESRIVCLHGIY